jgi:NDP-sugar pyrophosphorylase family protein
MKALVLSAGYGERLRPLTEKIPKPLLTVGGRPLIHYPLLMLKHAGIAEIAINVHHLADQIQDTLGDGSSLGVKITYSPEKTLRGTGGPLSALRSFFGNESFVVLNSDTILGLDLRSMIAFHHQCGGIATLALAVVRRPEAYSRIEMDSDARIRRMRLLKDRGRGDFIDYPNRLSAVMATTLKPYTYCGVLVAQPAVLGMAPKTHAFSLMSDLLAPIVAQGPPVFGYVHKGYFRTVDDLAAYRMLITEFSMNRPRFDYLA